MGTSGSGEEWTDGPRTPTDGRMDWMDGRRRLAMGFGGVRAGWWWWGDWTGAMLVVLVTQFLARFARLPPFPFPFTLVASRQSPPNKYI